MIESSNENNNNKNLEYILFKYNEILSEYQKKFGKSNKKYNFIIIKYFY